jgi:sec-independent protein translocase protein TatA
MIIGAKGLNGHERRVGQPAHPYTEGNHMLNNIGLPGLLLIAVVVLVLFGRGKISSLMGEVGKGITAFKRGVKDSTDEIENAGSTSGTTTGTTPARDVTPEAEKDKV